MTKTSPAGRLAAAVARLPRLWKWAGGIVVLLVLAPLVLTIVYVVVPPVSTLMLARLVTFEGYDRRWVPLEAISPHVVRAAIASEDGRFCEHHGVDWQALDKVLDDAGADGPSRGASTITMQTVKNLFLWPWRNAIRKGVEIALAEMVSTVWTKSRTMEIYLNIAEWGDGIFGIEAASRKYFKVSAARLTAHQAALLITALPNPLRRNPAHPSTAHRRLAATIEARARSIGPYAACVDFGK